MFGFFPACWTLYRRRGSEQQRVASRLAITLSLAWALGYSLLKAEGEAMIEGNAELLGVLLLLTNSLLSSGYFLVNLWLMVQLWQRKTLKLPGVSQVSKYLP